MNERIRISPVRLIDHNNEQVGIVDLDTAMRMAREAGLDLVEIAADVRPPVVRIMDYGKHKYEQSKQDKVNRSKSKTTELKEVRLGRSMKIDPHDIAIRLKQAREFLMEGHKVQIVQNFRGREMMHTERGAARMQEIAESLSDVSKVEMPARQAGRRMNMILGPDKAKVEAIKRRLAREKAQQEAEAKAKVEAEAADVADAAESALEQESAKLKSANEESAKLESANGDSTKLDSASGDHEHAAAGRESNREE